MKFFLFLVKCPNFKNRVIVQQNQTQNRAKNCFGILSVKVAQTWINQWGWKYGAGAGLLKGVGEAGGGGAGTFPN